ncbi:MAG: sigma-54 dependent transcriptional regulator [Planctomycetota bacterium]
MNPVILIVDDDEDTLDSLADLLALKGYEAEKASCLKAARAVLARRDPDGVLLDMKLPDGNGLDWIGALRKQLPDLAIVVITGAGDIPIAVEAMRRGADHFLTKPVNPEEMFLFLEKSLELEWLKREDLTRRRLMKPESIFWGECPAARELQDLAATAAENDSAILLQGETGTGKGVLARWIHENGPRSSNPFVEVNCSGLRGDLLASELFGHRKGAFTSAIEHREGLLEVANGGTLFLDEIGDMDLSVQAQFLNVIEEKQFRRVGEVKMRRSEFRLVCATNRDLSAQVEAKRFRGDLFFRICVFPIAVPGLCKRIEDLKGWVDHLLNVLRYGDNRVGKEAMSLLKHYSWPGNIRELRNVLERACLLAHGNELRPEHFPGLPVSSARPPSKEDKQSEEWDLVSHEASHIRHALASFKGNVGETAQALGVSRATLYRKLKQYRILLPKS